MISIILTVLAYAVIFGITGLIFQAANNSQSPVVAKRAVVVGVFFMSVFASLRALTVGTDTMTTISIYFTSQIGKTVSINTMMDLINEGIIYNFLALIIPFFGLGERTFLFVIELLIVAPVGIVAYKKREQIPMHYTMLLFSLLYYQVGFNWIRQSAASAFLILGLVYAEEKKTKKSVMVFIFEWMIHSSAIIGLSILLFVYAFMRIKNKYVKAFFSIGFIALFFFLLSRWDNIIAYGLNSGILPVNYAGYLRVFSGQTRVDNWFLVGSRIYVDYANRVLLVVIPLLLSKKDLSPDEQRHVSFYKIVSILGLITYSYILFTMHSPYGNRITYSIEYTQILNLGMCCSFRDRDNSDVSLRNLAVIGIALFYNIWLYYVLGWHDTVPFSFGF